jgi:negative regulator of replication initiation
MNRRGYKKPETIKILVCSGNLGNARPDLDSIDAWIPRDGYCRHVLESKYPVSLSSSMTSNSNNSIFSNGGAASQGEATTPPVPTIPRPFEQSLNSLLKQAKQTQHDIQTGKQQQHQQHHHSYNSSKQHDSRISMLTMNNRSSSSSDDFSKMDDLIASCIIEEDGVNISEHDESYDAFDSSLSLVNNEQFDIIVIGMQESTFDVVVDADSPTTPGEGFKTNANPLSPKEFNSAGLLSPKDILNPLLAVKAAKGVSNLTVKAAKGSAKKVTQAAKGSATIVSKAAKDSAKKVSNLTTAKDHTTLKKAMGGKSDDTHVLHDLLQEQLPSYSQATSYQRGEMRLIVLYQEDAIDLEVLSVKAQNTGRAGLANKGGIVTEVAVNQTTRLAFLTAHLEAHEGHAKYTTRCSTIADIFKGTESSVSSLRCDASISSHFMFVTGDLNFRTRLPDIEPGSPEHVELTHQLAYAKDYATLGKYDELSHALKKKDCLVGFQTPVCNFPPTFKVLRQEGYEYKDNRSPSYTDRILYLGADKLGEKIKVLGYEPIDTFSTSDHKPIRGAFELELNEKLKWRPVLANR